MIWFKKYDLKDINLMNVNTMMEYLDISIVHIDDNHIEATMPVDHRTVQPMRLLHGGASCVLAESIGSIAANLCIDPLKYYALGMNISTNHLRSSKEGEKVKAIATPSHLGRKTHLWEIKILNQEDKLVALSRLTMAIIER